MAEQLVRPLQVLLGQITLVALVLYVLAALLLHLLWWAFLYWSAAHLVQVKNATFGRGLKAAGLVIVTSGLVLGIAAGATYLLLSHVGPQATWLATMPVWVGLAGVALAPLLVLRGVFETTLRQALGILFCSSGMVVVSVALAAPILGLLVNVIFAAAAPAMAGAGP